MSLMWPMLLDLTKDECKRILRRLELEAYASMISAFRAQGELSKDKKKVLQELCTILGISTERHRAEIRRAVNDEKLATIADLVGGCSTYSEWAIEGRRLVPLMPRLVPQTAYTNIANNAALIVARHNASLSPPSTTSVVVKSENLPVSVGNTIKSSNKSAVHAAEISPNATQVTNKVDSLLDFPVIDQNNQQMPIISSPSNVLVLPSGVSFQVKSATNSHDGVQQTPELKSRKRKRSSSTELSLPQQKLTFTNSSGILTPLVTKSTVAPSTMLSTSATSKTVSIPIGGTPVQFTLTSSTPKVVTSSSLSTVPTQKVILVSTSCSNLQSSILQRSLTVPIVKTVTTTGTMASVTQSLGKASSLITPISSSSPGTLVLPSGSMTSVGSSSPTVPQTTTTTSGLKIITQTVPVSSGSKFVPKSSAAGGGIPPIVVVTKTGAVTGNQSGTRLVNVLGTQASAGRLLNPTTLSVTKNASALVTVGPNGKQTTLLKVPPGMSISSAGGKPNVIVVQKAHVLQQSQSGNAFTISASALSGSQTMLKPTSITSARDGGSRHAILIPKGRSGVMQTVTLASSSESSSDKDMTQITRKSTVLADLLQAAGILPDGGLEPAQLTDLPSSCIEELKLEENLTDLNVSSVVPAFQNKESANVSILPVIETSTDLMMADKTISKLQKCESGELDPKTGLFGPCLRHSPSESIESETSITVEKKNDQVTIERKLSNVKQPKTSQCFVKLEDNVSALRRELLAGRSSSGSSKKRDGVKLTESKVDKNDSAIVKDSNNTQLGRTYLYRGATYSKGDAANRRKKMLSATKNVSPVKRDERTKPKTEVVVVPCAEEIVECQASQETASKQFIIENETLEIGACDEIHFTDENLTAVFEETVVTTDETDDVTNEVAEECFDNSVLGDKVGFEICRQPDEGLETIEVVSEDHRETTDVAFKTVQKLNSPPSDTHSGSSVFMVSDSTFGNKNSSKRNTNELYQDNISVDQKIHSTFINQQGVCEITGIEGGSEMLEIIGCIDDFDSVESKVAALHGENESSDHPIPTKKRKKQVFDVVSDDLPSIIPHLHGWSRGATGLLLRVMKFRGVGRMKGEPSAAHWFLQPVTAEEAPGYYEVVKNPMDFSTIKKKLEMCVYKDVSEFHDDMMLIKSNCEVYNPPEHPARQDCKEVFAFYQVEYDRLMEKWQKAHLFSPQKKRLT